jgi:hypothetical protein
MSGSCDKMLRTSVHLLRQVADQGHVVLEGNLTQEYFLVRRLLYEQFAWL